MKRIPKKYRNHGFHLWCSACKKVVTSAPCHHHQQHRYQSRIYNPLTKRQNCIKTHQTDDLMEAWKAHNEYRAHLQAHKYQAAAPPPLAPAVPVFLKEAALMYIDYLADVNVPDYEKKNLSGQYITDETRYIRRFLEVVQRMEGAVGTFPIAAISTTHTQQYVAFVESLRLSDRSYNAHIKAVRYLFQHCIKHLHLNIENPFKNVRIRQLVYDPEIIPVEEFERLLEVITYENGHATKGTTHKPLNYYRPWLKKAFIFSLLVGERLDGIVLLRWSDIKDNYIGIPNWKVNRIKKTNHYVSYTPITKDLAELLTEFDLSADENQYILAPEYTNRGTLKSLISRSFTHYWGKTGLTRKVTFKNLRKTYITRITDLIGEKALFIKHGKNDKTAIKHYLDKKELISETRNLKLYDTTSWLHNT